MTDATTLLALLFRYNLGAQVTLVAMQADAHPQKFIITERGLLHRASGLQRVYACRPLMIDEMQGLYALGLIRFDEEELIDYPQPPPS